MQFDPNKKAPEPREGIFKFTCSKAKEGTDKNGNDYLKLSLLVSIPGNDIPLRAGAFLSSHPKMIFKLQHFCECGGELGLAKFQTGEVTAADCEGVEGWGKFVPDMSGYSDLDTVDFLPERKLAKLAGADKDAYEFSVQQYAQAESDGLPEEPSTAGAGAAIDDIPF